MAPAVQEGKAGPEHTLRGGRGGHDRERWKHLVATSCAAQTPAKPLQGEQQPPTCNVHSADHMTNAMAPVLAALLLAGLLTPANTLHPCYLEKIFDPADVEVTLNVTFGASHNIMTNSEQTLTLDAYLPPSTRDGRHEVRAKWA